MPKPRIKDSTSIAKTEESLFEAVTQVLTNTSNDIRIDIYIQIVGNLITKGKDNEIFNGLINRLDAHFGGWYKSLQRTAKYPLLLMLHENYQNFKIYCKDFPAIYIKYDLKYKDVPNKTINGIREVFMKKVLFDEELFNSVTRELIGIINNARTDQDGLLRVQDTVKDIVQMYYSFKNEKLIFTKFIDALESNTKNFCKEFCNKNFNGDFCNFLLKASEQFSTEKTIMNMILEPEEATEILVKFITTILQNNEKKFLNSDKLGTALRSENTEPLKWLITMYNDFNLFGFDISIIYTECAKIISEKMLQYVEQFQNPRDIYSLMDGLINETMDYYNKYINYFTTKKSHQELNKAIESAWNNQGFNIQENLAIYIDYLIRNRIIENKVKTICFFYKLTNDKKVFAENYNFYFSKRYIEYRRKLFLTEEYVITEIRKISSGFMKTFDAISNIFKNSGELHSIFVEKNGNIIKEAKDIEPLIMPLNLYPFETGESTSIPGTANKLNEAFIKFYHDQRKGNRSIQLQEKGSLIEMAIKANINAKNVIFKVTSDLACANIIMFMINKKRSTMREIYDILMGNDERKKITIAQTIVHYLLRDERMFKLRRVGDSPNFEDNDELSLNPEYFDQKEDGSEIFISPFRLKKATQVVKQIILSDKVVSIRAAIERCLKKSKKISRELLIQNVKDRLKDVYTLTREDIIPNIYYEVERGVTKEVIENGDVYFTFEAKTDMVTS